MKKVFLLTALFMLASGIYAQDTIHAINVFRHYIKDGKNTPEKCIVEQQTYNKEKQLILKITYLDSVTVIKDFTRYYYDDDSKLLSEEFYTAEGEIIQVKRFTYLPSGAILSERVWEPEDHSMINRKSIEYSYTKGALSSIKVLNHKGKWREKHVINRIDSTVITSIKYHKHNAEKLKTKTVTKVYSGDKIKRETCHKVFRDKQEKNCECEYFYNAQNKLSDERKSTDGELQKHIKYSWYSRGTMNSKRVYNAEEELIDYFHYVDREHEIKLDPLPQFDLSKPLK